MYLRKTYAKYRPQRSCGQGYVFTRVCDSVHRGICLSACWDTATPPKKEAPPSLPRRPPCQGDPHAKKTPSQAHTQWGN